LGGIEIAGAEPKARAFDRQRLHDQLRAGEWDAAGPRVAPKPMPEPEEPPLQAKGVAIEALRRPSRGEFLPAA
jgi:hypothetical protein